MCDFTTMFWIAIRWIAGALLKTTNWAALAITITTLVDQALKYVESNFGIPLETGKKLFIKELFDEADKIGLSRNKLIERLPVRVRTMLGLKLGETASPTIDKNSLNKITAAEAGGFKLKGAAKISFFRKLIKNPMAVAITLMAASQLDVLAWGPKMIAEGFAKWGFGDWFKEREYKEIGTEWTRTQLDDLAKAYHQEGANQLVLPNETGLQDLTPDNLGILEERLRQNAATRGEVWERQDFIREAIKWIKKDGKPFKPSLIMPEGRATW